MAEVGPDVGPEVLAEWVGARSAALQRFAYLVTGSREQARDLVQDALTGVLPRWQALWEAGTLEAYLRRSIVNASISAWRRRVPTAELTESAGVEPAGDDAVLDALVARRLLEELPPTQRAAVVLRFYDDLAYAAIAETLGCTEPTARSHVHRALASLRERLGPTQPGGADDV